MAKTNGDDEVKSLDFKSDSQRFALEHGCYPAATVQKAMEHGASVALAAASERVRAARADLNKAHNHRRY